VIDLRQGLRVRLTTDRTYDFPFGPDEFWARISRVDQFQQWWPWLRRFDGEALETGHEWSCEVHPPVPYVVHFAVRIDEVVPGRSVAAQISGDILGTARIHVEADGPGCSVRLVSDLAPAKQSLRVISIAARPMVRFGHNWILDVGVRQFRANSATPLYPEPT
jgi:Polyketide cyclase / dehydrase and lipid transport